MDWVKLGDQEEGRQTVNDHLTPTTALPLGLLGPIPAVTVRHAYKSGTLGGHRADDLAAPCEGGRFEGRESFTGERHDLVAALGVELLEQDG